MEFAELVIVFAVTITLSNIASRILPMIPAPLIQIFLGVVLGLTEWGQSIDFEPELFLVMIIAPLLFREGEKADLCFWSSVRSDRCGSSQFSFWTSEYP